MAYYPEKRWIAWVGFPLAAYMGLAMIDGDHHWVSDVIAGGLLGHVIGWTIGKAFARETSSRLAALSGSRQAPAE